MRRRIIFFLLIISNIMGFAHGITATQQGDVDCIPVPPAPGSTTVRTTCDLIHVWHTNTGKATLVTSANKYSLPTAASVGFKNISQSFIRTHTYPYHPPA